jgi:hypothetical protein
MSAACETVITRLISDAGFRRSFEDDRQTTLRGLELTAAERDDLLALDMSTLGTNARVRRDGGVVGALKTGRD